MVLGLDPLPPTPFVYRLVYGARRAVKRHRDDALEVLADKLPYAVAVPFTYSSDRASCRSPPAFVMQSTDARLSFAKIQSGGKWLICRL